MCHEIIRKLADDSLNAADHDGCTFLCPKIRKSVVARLETGNSCVFNRNYIQFEKIIQLSQMSLINGLTDTLFNEFRRNLELNKYQFSFSMGPEKHWSSCCESLIGYVYII